MVHMLLSGRFVASAMLALVLLCGPGAVLGQESKTLDVGSTLYRTNAALTDDHINWPRYTPPLESNMLSFYGVIIGIDEDWTDETGTPHSKKIAQVQDNNFADIKRVTVPVEGAFKRVYRNPYPTKVLDGDDWTDITARQDPVDPSIPSDAMIYTHLTTWTGIDIERWAYAFANDAYGDFIILEYRFTNTSTEAKEGVYLGLPAQMTTTATQPTDIWTNYYGVTYSEYVAGDPSADTMRVLYSWDGNELKLNQDTKGNPTSIWGNFRKPHYYAQAVLHADESAGNESDDPSQPVKVGWANWDYDLNMNEETHESAYAILAEGWPDQMPKSYSQTVNASGNEVKNGMYRRLRPGIDVRDFDAAVELAKTGMYSFGPYTLQPGEDVRIVMAFTGGSISTRLAIEAGLAYDSGYGELRPRQPLPYDVYDPDGNLIAREGELLTKDQKDTILDMGKELVFQNAAKAIRTWKEGNVKYGEGSFDIPLAPAAPSLTGYSENDQIRLEWGDEAEMDAEAGPIVGYRIYRGYKRPPSITMPTDTTFVQIAEVEPGAREYVDTEVIRGEDYYYYITAVNDEGIESSRFLNRTGTTQDRTLEALAPTRPPDADWKQNMRVVPNPYHVLAAKKYPGKRLNFLNMPAYAKIHIYTVAGDRVQTLYHDSNTGDEDWERQNTFNTMEIVSGVYFYVVEELDGPRGSPTGETAIGKFVVIK